MLPMKQLAALFSEQGAVNVRTYIQSGNVVFELPADIDEKEFGQRSEGLIKEQFRVVTPIVLRSAQELSAVLSGNPFLEQGKSEAELHVLFLKDEPTGEAVAGLDAKRSPPDEFIVHGREIYLWLPGGVANSKLTNAYFDSRLKTIGTSRNWRTVQTLCQMTQ